MVDRMHLKVLGNFEVSSQNRILTPTSKKAQALLAYLAIERNTPQNRDHLADLLWGNLGDERARHNLRQALSSIRQSCGPVIVTDGDLVALDWQDCASDIAEFLSGANSNDQFKLAACLKLYEGDLLENIQVRSPAFEDWLRDTRMQIRTYACSAIGQLADLLVRQGSLEAAEDAYRKRLQMDALCESAHRGLMSLLARTNRRTDALRQYQLCEDAFHRELGVEPEAETKALLQQIRDGLLNAGQDQVVELHLGLDKSSAPVVAVLPFDNLSGEEDLYFADGITEDLTTALSRFHDLQVISRGSSFAYRGKDVPEAEMAAALGAHYLVRGSVRRSDTIARITVQLLDCERGLTVWAETYDRQLKDVFDLQNEIVSTLVVTLVGRVETARLKQVRSVPVERLDAYDILLRGKYHHHLFTAKDCQACIECFDLAIKRDPNYAIAHAWLACGYGQAMVHNLGDVPELVDLAEAAAERGLELDEDESECHRVLAQVSLSRGNLQRALWHQRRALFLNPNDDRSICAMGELLTFAGEAEEGEKWVRQSLKLNPYHPQRYWSHLARALIHQGLYADALDVLQQIARPRIDDLVYTIVASTNVADQDTRQRALDALHRTSPDFDVLTFTDTLPYERVEDRSLILDTLRVALP